MATIPTVKIKGGKDEPEYLIINAEDFDEEVHEIYVEKKKPAAKEEDTGNEGADAAAALRKLKKADLVAKAQEKGLEFVPDEKTVAQLIEMLTAGEE
jgi:hypothetical protein